MSKYTKINLNTIGGAKTLLKDLREQLKNITPQADIQGYKSVYYHRKKTQRLIEELEKGNKEALAEAKRYFSRGGQHKKPIDTFKDAKGNLIYKKAPKIQQTKPTAQAGYTFYEFIYDWDEIRWHLPKPEQKNLDFRTLVYGIGADYERFRDRLANALGMPFAQLLEYMQMAKEIYFNKDNEYLNLAYSYQETEEQDLWNSIENYLLSWGAPEVAIGLFIKFVWDAADVGKDVWDNFWF